MKSCVRLVQHAWLGLQQQFVQVHTGASYCRVHLHARSLDRTLSGCSEHIRANRDLRHAFRSHRTRPLTPGHSSSWRLLSPTGLASTTRCSAWHSSSQLDTDRASPNTLHYFSHPESRTTGQDLHVCDRGTHGLLQECNVIAQDIAHIGSCLLYTSDAAD